MWLSPPKRTCSETTGVRFMRNSATAAAMRVASLSSRSIARELTSVGGSERSCVCARVYRSMKAACAGVPVARSTACTRSRSRSRSAVSIAMRPSGGVSSGPSVAVAITGCGLPWNTSTSLASRGPSTTGSACTVPSRGARFAASSDGNISPPVVMPESPMTNCWSEWITEYVAWWKKHVRRSISAGSRDHGRAARCGAPPRSRGTGAISGAAGCTMPGSAYVPGTLQPTGSPSADVRSSTYCGSGAPPSGDPARAGRGAPSTDSGSPAPSARRPTAPAPRRALSRSARRSIRIGVLTFPPRRRRPRCRRP